MARKARQILRVERAPGLSAFNQRNLDVCWRPAGVEPISAAENTEVVEPGLLVRDYPTGLGMPPRNDEFARGTDLVTHALDCEKRGGELPGVFWL